MWSQPNDDGNDVTVRPRSSRESTLLTGQRPRHTLRRVDRRAGWRYRWAAALLLVAVLAACGSAEREFASPEVGVAGLAQVDSFAESESTIRTVSLVLLAADPDSTVKASQDLVESTGGRLESLRSAALSAGPHYQVVFRVPADQLDSVVDQLKKFAAEVLSETRTNENVTDQVVDLDARTRVLKLTEQQLEELLAESRTAGRDAQGIMAIFRELTSIRERRESLESQLANLRGRVELSRLDLRIEPPRTVHVDWALGASFNNAVDSLLVTLRLLLTLIIYVVIVVIPVLAMVAIPAMLGIKVLRRRKKT